MQMFQFYINLACLNARLAKCLHKFLIVKALVNKDKALVGAFSGHYETSRRFVDSSSSSTEYSGSVNIVWTLRDTSHVCTLRDNPDIVPAPGCSGSRDTMLPPTRGSVKWWTMCSEFKLYEVCRLQN